TNIKEAVSQMMDTKKFYGKIIGRAALHMCISLPENESNIANSTKLMDLCKDVLNEIFPNNQAVFAIHTNTDNLHVHIIVNSVGLNGKNIVGQFSRQNICHFIMNLC
ncbi:MAG: relaxase/mobilization nuclease domain-containing protein, partial [Aeriscardovia sp.]|nr:relaxase/mobilization nuclease domain-containing protein [Aeriscardovia sp.]